MRSALIEVTRLRIVISVETRWKHTNFNDMGTAYHTTAHSILYNKRFKSSTVWTKNSFFSKRKLLNYNKILQMSAHQWLMTRDYRVTELERERQKAKVLFAKNVICTNGYNLYTSRLRCTEYIHHKHGSHFTLQLFLYKCVLARLRPHSRRSGRVIFLL